MWERQGDDDRWWTAILTHIFLVTLCHIQGLTAHLLLAVTLMTVSLWLTIWRWCPCIYNFPMPTRFRLSTNMTPAVNPRELLRPTYHCLFVYTAGSIKGQYATHGITFILCSYSRFFIFYAIVSSEFWRVYSYQIQIILKQIYLTHKSDSNKFYHSRSEGNWEWLQWKSTPNS